MSAQSSKAVGDVSANQMPRGIWFIVSNEFAERFCYYGINSILVVYLTNFMHFSEARAASQQAFFKAGAYFFPLFGAVVADVLWGKFKTITVFSTLYSVAALGLALFGNVEIAMQAALFFIGFGTGGIKPCVSTNVGDQFSSKNAHLIERAFSLFYLSINLGSSISIYLCPELLDNPAYGPRWAFGVPAIMMIVATLVFVSGRRQYKVIPPAGEKWLKEVTSPETLKLIGRLLVIYFFVAAFWMLWDQANGNTWTLQVQSSLVDKNFFGLTFRPAQIQVVNGLFILLFTPIMGFVVYPRLNRYVRVTPLRKIGAGLFITVLSFLIVAWIERRIMNGIPTHAGWQVLAYAVLSIGEVLVSITALEFSYKQAPLSIKSFIMALFLLSTAVGNLGIAAVNRLMVREIPGATVTTGSETWVTLPSVAGFVRGQKLDVLGDNGLTNVVDGKRGPLKGTFVISEIDTATNRVHIIDNVTRLQLTTEGTFNTEKGSVATYRLVGPEYFLFFAAMLTVLGLFYIVVAMRYPERDFVREE